LTVSAAVETLGRAQLTFAQQVRRNGETLVRASVNVACAETNSLKPAPFPEVIRASLAVGANSVTIKTTQAVQTRRHLNRV